MDVVIRISTQVQSANKMCSLTRGLPKSEISLQNWGSRGLLKEQETCRDCKHKPMCKETKNDLLLSAHVSAHRKREQIIAKKQRHPHCRVPLQTKKKGECEIVQLSAYNQVNVCVDWHPRVWSLFGFQGCGPHRFHPCPSYTQSYIQ